MNCVGCGSDRVSERGERTAQGYRRFRCSVCGRQFNERSAGLLNRAQYPSDVIALVVFFRLRYKLSLRDLAEIFLLRGIEFSHESVRHWEALLIPALVATLRRRRAGNLVDVMLSEKRDMAAAMAFFRSAKTVTGVTPLRVTTDGHDSYPRAIRTMLGAHVRHRTSRYLNNRIEQDHRGIKSRYGPMRGFGAADSAARFCICHDELRNHLRLGRHRTSVSSALRRHFIRRSQSALDVLAAA